MSESSTEEKSQPASERKLREARRRGQIAHSQDLVSAMVFMACVVYLAWRMPSGLARMADLFDLAGEQSAQAFPIALHRMLGEVFGILLDWLAPLLCLAVATAMFTGAVNARGLMIATDPLIPQYERIDPVAGFKRLCSMRSVIEFAKALLKLIVLLALLTVVFRRHLQRLLTAPQCGLPCLEEAFIALLWPLTATAVVACLVIGLADSRLQGWLYRRDMRMTHSETKRERKDNDGDPHVRHERKRLRRASQLVGSERGIAHATLVIGDHAGWTVGLRYKRGVTPVPVVVYRAPPFAGAEARLEAASRNIPVVPAPALAEAIARQAPPGSAIPATTFQQVANLLVRARLL